MRKVLRPNKYEWNAWCIWKSLSLYAPRACNHITFPVADEAEKELKKILYTAEKENKTHFCEFDKSDDSLDEFFMRCLSDIVWFKVASVVNIKLFFYGLILLWCDNIN